MRILRKFIHNASGATAIEYGLIIGLIFLAVVASITNFSAKTGIMYNNIANNMH